MRPSMVVGAITTVLVALVVMAPNRGAVMEAEELRPGECRVLSRDNKGRSSRSVCRPKGVLISKSN